MTAHGLEVAVESLAGRSPVPVELVVDLDHGVSETCQVPARRRRDRGIRLRGLADRMEAVGGRLQVWSPASGGTPASGPSFRLHRDGLRRA